MRFPELKEKKVKLLLFFRWNCWHCLGAKYTRLNFLKKQVDMHLENQMACARLLGGWFMESTRMIKKYVCPLCIMVNVCKTVEENNETCEEL